MCIFGIAISHNPCGHVNYDNGHNGKLKYVSIRTDSLYENKINDLRNI